MREILVFGLVLLCGLSMGEECKKHLHSLATAQELFVRCTTLHAVPVEMCQECKKTYDDILEAYSNLTKTKNCSGIYIEPNDRLHIIFTTQSILIGLWTKAFCEDCFANNNIADFNDKYIVLDNCFAKTNQINVCKVCLPSYKDLNDFYIHLDQHNNAKVCYDIQDRMNRTRSKWSQTYKCCHRSFDITLFLIASSFFGALPFLFYTGMFLHGKRRERNHGVLDADAEDAAPLVSAETSPLEQNTIVAPTPILAPTPVKYMNLESDSSDGDSDYGASSPKKKIV